MEETKLAEFNKELTALLKKYGVILTIEDVPATKKIVVAPVKMETTSETTGTKESEVSETTSNEPKE